MSEPTYDERMQIYRETVKVEADFIGVPYPRLPFSYPFAYEVDWHRFLVVTEMTRTIAALATGKDKKGLRIHGFFPLKQRLRTAVRAQGSTVFPLTEDGMLSDRSIFPNMEGNDATIQYVEFLLTRLTLELGEDSELVQVFVGCLKWAAEVDKKARPINFGQYIKLAKGPVEVLVADAGIEEEESMAEEEEEDVDRLWPVAECAASLREKWDNHCRGSLFNARVQDLCNSFVFQAGGGSDLDPDDFWEKAERENDHWERFTEIGRAWAAREEYYIDRRVSLIVHRYGQGLGRRAEEATDAWAMKVFEMMKGQTGHQDDQIMERAEAGRVERAREKAAKEEAAKVEAERKRVEAEEQEAEQKRLAAEEREVEMQREEARKEREEAERQREEAERMEVESMDPELERRAMVRAGRERRLAEGQITMVYNDQTVGIEWEKYELEIEDVRLYRQAISGVSRGVRDQIFRRRREIKHSIRRLNQDYEVNAVGLRRHRARVQEAYELERSNLEAHARRHNLRHVQRRR